MLFATATDIGIFRKENQDATSVFKNDVVTVAILCDGMGGHVGGKYAANLTIKAFQKNFKKHPPNDSRDLNNWMIKTLELAKKLMEKRALKNYQLLDMGTTMTCAFIYQHKAVIFNIGDSRTYLFNGSLHQITIDHNLRNYYIHQQGATEAQANKIHGGNALTSALGPTKTSDIESFEVGIDSTLSFFILTSDGIHDHILKPEFEAIISSNKLTLDQKCQKIIKRAVKHKSQDNLTIAIVEVNHD